MLVADKNSIALVHNYKNIEEVRFGGSRSNPDHFIDYAIGVGAYLGQTSFDRLSSGGYLTNVYNFDTSSDGINKLLSAAEFNSEIVL